MDLNTIGGIINVEVYNEYFISAGPYYSKPTYTCYGYFLTVTLSNTETYENGTHLSSGKVRNKKILNPLNKSVQTDLFINFFLIIFILITDRQIRRTFRRERPQ